MDPSAADRVELERLERAMWATPTRGDPAWMDAHLTDDFAEVGPSGRRWSRSEVVELPLGVIDAELVELNVRLLGDGLALVSSRSVEGRGDAHRTSLWRRVDDRWLLAHHQGTSIPPATGDSRLGLVTIVVDDYDVAIRFFTDALGFELVEDSPETTIDGRPKRWVVVRPAGTTTGVLLAEADGHDQSARIGDQVGGRVGFFLHVDDFWARHATMLAAGDEFLEQPRTEPYGTVAVFRDVAGNRWDLLGPA